MVWFVHFLFKPLSFEINKKSIVNIFGKPSKPKRSKELRLDSRDRKTSLSLSQVYESEKYPRQIMVGRSVSGWSTSTQSTSRRNTQSSISSTSSRASATQATSSGKPEPLIKGLVLKFHSETGLPPKSLMFKPLISPNTLYVTKTYANTSGG
jgi:hypothetical protein